MTECRRCGKECGGFGHYNTVYNPWADTREDFALCDECQYLYASKVVRFLNYREVRQ